MSETCPNGCNLQGSPIPQEYIDKGLYAEGLTHYSRRVGVEIRGVYDGVLYWKCPDCGASWHRFAETETRLRNAADKHMAKEITETPEPECRCIAKGQPMTDFGVMHTADCGRLSWFRSTGGCMGDV